MYRTLFIFTLITFSLNSFALSPKKRSRVCEKNQNLNSKDIFEDLIKLTRNNKLKNTVPMESKQLYYPNSNIYKNILKASNKDLFKYIGRIIRNARKQVFLQTFLYQSNSYAGRKIVKALLELEKNVKKRKGEPVHVHLLINSPVAFAGFYSKFPGVFNRKSKKDQDGYYNLGLKQTLDPNYVVLKIKTFNHALLGATHAKTIVVDNAIGIVTGANLKETHDLLKQDNDLYTVRNDDHAFILTGSVVEGFVDDFKTAWDKEGEFYRSNIIDLDKKPVTEKNRLLAPIIINQNQMSLFQNEIFKDLNKKQFTNDRLGLGIKALSFNKTDFVQNVHVILVTKSHREIINRNDSIFHNQVFYSLIDNAKSRLNIISPSLNQANVIEKIIKSAQRGVQVNIVLSKNYQDHKANKPFQGGTNQSNVDKIINALKKDKDPTNDNNVQFRWFKSISGELSNAMTNSSHTKYLSADNEIVLTGSSNLDMQSFYQSREFNVALSSTEVAKLWCQQLFEPVWERALPATH